MMGIVSTLLGAGRQAGVSQDRNASDDFWWQDLKAGGRSASGPYVTPDNAMRLTVVMACVRILADTLASLPIKIVRGVGGGNVEPVERHPIGLLLGGMVKPNEFQNSQQLKHCLMGHLALRGNAYAEIRPGRLGAVSELWPIHPDRVKPERLDTGRVRYTVQQEAGGERVFTQDEIWHLRGLALSEDGICGVDPITAARDAIGKGLAAQDYGGRFFANDARPSGILKHPASFKTDDDRQRFKSAWQEAFGGTNRFKTAVLEFGLDYQQIGLTNEQSQFLETMKQNAVEIAQLFRIPPHKVGLLDKATFSNIEQQNIEFVTDTLLPWLTNWEQSINSDLIVANERFQAKFTVNALLRGAIRERFQAYAIGRQWGWLSANDVRRLEDMNSIGPEGDSYLVPLNMVPADEAEMGDDDGQPNDDAGFGDNDGRDALNWSAATNGHLANGHAAGKPNGHG